MPDQNASIRDRLAGVARSILDGRPGSRPSQIATNLREAGLTSLDMVKLVLRIEDEFSITFGPDDMDPANFESLDLLEPVVLRLAA